MKFNLTIDLENDAFADDFTGELATCLDDVASAIAEYSPKQIQTLLRVCGDAYCSTILDSNGNTVGEWEFRNS